ncbi:membrane protein [Chitinimonas prasina]|uniref:Membrane protein n=1 Tax=Chitinimonas prasina TaxID=1434937 RepID=A0ABQ5Y9J7_9NEIS|nr:porin [Chitinimonas prasina]GLR11625.1 membrane protein [Chitinimonas prasina]
MKLHAIAAALALVGTVASAADSNVTVYGRMDMGLELHNDGKLRRVAVQNFSSRLGFRGEEGLGDGLSAIWQIESGVSPDDSANSGSFASRNSFVGLKGEFGTVLMGNYDTPFKSLDKNVGLLWNQGDSVEQITHGKASELNFHTRQKNVIQYHSPKFSGVQIKLAYGPDEAKGSYTAPAEVGSNRQVYSMSAEYDGGKWNVGAAYDVKQDQEAKGKDWHASKLIAGAKFGDFTLGAAISQLDNDAGRKVDTLTVNGAYKVGPMTYKASIGTADESAANANDGVDLFAIEVNYAISKMTSFYGYYAQFSNDARARARFEAGDNKYRPARGDDPKVFGVAMRHNF